jgi:hypothetical protein
MVMWPQARPHDHPGSRTVSDYGCCADMRQRRTGLHFLTLPNSMLHSCPATANVRPIKAQKD